MGVTPQVFVEDLAVAWSPREISFVLPRPDKGRKVLFCLRRSDRGRKVRPLAYILVKSVVDNNHKVRGYDLRQAGQVRDHRYGLHWVR